MEDFDRVLGLLGLKLVNSAVAVFASFSALQFFDGLRVKEKWLTFLGGWSVAAWGAGPLREYLEVKPGVEVGIVLVLGLFGMAMAAEVIAFIRTADFMGVITALFRKKGERDK